MCKRFFENMNEWFIFTAIRITFKQNFESL